MFRVAVLFLGLFAWGIFAENAPPKYPLQSDLDGPKSVYTPLMKEMARHWPPPGFDEAAVAPDHVQMVCLSTPHSRYSVGVQQSTWIHAPLSVVDSVMNQIGGLKDIFPGFKHIDLVSQDANQMLIFYEQIVPVFFLPNVKYQITYLGDHSDPHRYFYRYQLKKAGDLNWADGFIVVEDHGNETFYSEYDFGDANYGILKILGANALWKDAVEELYVALAGLKLHIENPTWDSKEIAERAQAMLDHFPLDKALDNKQLLFLLNGDGTAKDVAERDAASAH